MVEFDRLLACNLVTVTVAGGWLGCYLSTLEASVRLASSGAPNRHDLTFRSPNLAISPPPPPNILTLLLHFRPRSPCNPALISHAIKRNKKQRGSCATLISTLCGRELGSPRHRACQLTGHPRIITRESRILDRILVLYSSTSSY